MIIVANKIISKVDTKAKILQVTLNPKVIISIFIKKFKTIDVLQATIAIITLATNIVIILSNIVRSPFDS